MYELKNPSVAKAYRAWSHMKGRCYCVTDKSYPNYGGRGVTVFEGWRHSFDSFYEYVSQLENFGRDGYSLNRIDNNGNYEPGNVEWASYTSQQNNKRSNRLITYEGRTQTLGQWSKELGFDYRVTWWRIYKLGWSAEEAFTNNKYPMYHRKGCSSCTN